MRSFYDLDRNELTDLLTSNQIPTVHVKTILKTYYKGKIFPSDYLPKKWDQLTKSFDFNKLEIASTHLSRYDWSVKFLFKLEDGALIETVLMPEKNRLTLCVSSQVGCRQNCSFCDTGRMGLKRNLTTHEIVLQWVSVNEWLQQNKKDLPKEYYPESLKLSNVVFMGMGEPLDNVENVCKAVKILIDPWGAQLAHRKITISTAGFLPGVLKLKESGLKVGLALSVHAVKNLLRAQLLPIQRSYPLVDVFKEMIDLCKNWNRELLIQYTVFDQINDSEEDAQALADFLSQHPIKVNLIPYNQTGKSRFRSPDAHKLEAFKNVLYTRGIRAMIRYSKGQDISAACGQLVVSNKER